MQPAVPIGLSTKPQQLVKESSFDVIDSKTQEPSKSESKAFVNEDSSKELEETVKNWRAFVTSQASYFRRSRFPGIPGD